MIYFRNYIMYIIYINDMMPIHDCLDISYDNNLILFADSISLIIRKNNNIDLTNQLLSDIRYILYSNGLYDWFILNKLKLNAAK